MVHPFLVPAAAGALAVAFAAGAAVAARAATRRTPEAWLRDPELAPAYRHAATAPLVRDLLAAVLRAWPYWALVVVGSAVLHFDLLGQAVLVALLGGAGALLPGTTLHALDDEDPLERADRSRRERRERRRRLGQAPRPAVLLSAAGVALARLTELSVIAAFVGLGSALGGA